MCCGSGGRPLYFEHLFRLDEFAMARVTVEDCVLLIPNRFELVMLAAQRARDVSAGAAPSVARARDKNPVVALRELAAETQSLDGLNESLIKGQKRVRMSEESGRSVAGRGVTGGRS